MSYQGSISSIKPAPLFQKIEGDVSWIIQIQCRLVSDILEESSELSQEVQAHIIRWFLNPDIGSPFDRKTKAFRNIIPKTWIIPCMRWLWYDGIIGLFEDEIIGHAFFQKHKKETGYELHLFSIAVPEELHRRWIGTKIGQIFVESGRKQENISRLRMGWGWDEKVKAIFTKIEKQSAERGISTDPDFFITFIDGTARLVDATIQPVKK